MKENSVITIPLIIACMVGVLFYNEASSIRNYTDTQVEILEERVVELEDKVNILEGQQQENASGVDHIINDLL